MEFLQNYYLLWQKSPCQMLAGILSTPLEAVLLIFVDQNVCRIIRNIEKLEQNPWKILEFIFRNLQVLLKSPTFLKTSSPIDILRNKWLNDYFQTECMNWFLWILWILTKVRKINPHKMLVICQLSKINLDEI